MQRNFSSPNVNIKWPHTFLKVNKHPGSKKCRTDDAQNYFTWKKQIREPTPQLPLALPGIRSRAGCGVALPCQYAGSGPPLRYRGSSERGWRAHRGGSGCHLAPWRVRWAGPSPPGLSHRDAHFPVTWDSQPAHSCAAREGDCQSAESQMSSYGKGATEGKSCSTCKRSKLRKHTHSEILLQNFNTHKTILHTAVKTKEQAMANSEEVEG